MLSNLYSLKGAGEVGLEADDALGRGQEMSGLGASGAELTLQVGLCEFGVEQGHFRRRMAKQFHERRKADAGAEHLGSEGVATMPHAA
jgi:hypothetical protein